MAKTKIIFRPTKQQLDRIFNTNTDTFKFRYSELNETEKMALEFLMKKFKIKELIRVPEVNIPDGIKRQIILLMVHHTK